MLAMCSDVSPIAVDPVVGQAGSFNVDPVLHGVLLTYAAERRDTFGGLWIDRQSGGTVVVAFTDDPEPHRQALLARRPSPDDVHAVEPPPAITDDRPIGEWGVPLAVVHVTYTEDQLRTGMSTMMSVLRDAGHPVESVGVDSERNVLSVTLSGPLTPAGLEAVTKTLGDVQLPLDMVCVDGELVDEVPDPIEPGTPLDVIVLPDQAGNYPPGTPVECGGVVFPLGALDVLTPIEEVDPALRAVLDGWLATPEGSFLPGDGWTLLYVHDRNALFINVADASVAFVGAEMGRNGWIYSGGSAADPCALNVVLPEGLGVVEWELDAGAPPPEAGTTELQVLVTERACTGGRELGERLLGPQVVETDESVRISFAAIALTGNHACPSNPATPVTVELDAPLGDRELRDGRLVGAISELVDD